MPGSRSTALDTQGNFRYLLPTPIQPRIISFLNIILTLDLDIRKALLKLCRVQIHPDQNLFLASQLPPRSSLTTSLSDPGVVYQLSNLYDTLFNLSPTAVHFSFWSMALRNLHYPKQHFKRIEEKNREESATKEFQATQVSDLPSALDYSALFCRPDEPLLLHPLIDSNAGSYRFVRHKLHNWGGQMESRRLILPRTSNKAMARRSQRVLEAAHPYRTEEWRKSGRQCSSLLHERLREEGERVPSDRLIEMRQAWKFNDLTPRTYYAYSTGAHEASKYVQILFNSFLDMMPTTHRKRRFHFSRLKIQKDDSVLIYDFTSFTSLMHEQKHFLLALASSTRGKTITVFDPSVGVQYLDLGDLLHRYTMETNHSNTPYETGPMVSSYLGEDTYLHKRAGFLGINGNLASCTALHGIVLVLVALGHYRCSCIGDDGLLCLTYEAPPNLEELGELDQRYIATVFLILNLIGVVHTWKSKVIEPSSTEVQAVSESWVYIKRPLKVLRGSIIEGHLYDFPSLALILRYGPQDTTRTMHFEMVDAEVLPRVASQMYRFRYRLWEDRAFMDDEEYDFLREYLMWTYKILGWNRCGHIGQWESLDDRLATKKRIPLFFYPAIPGLVEEWDIEPLTLTVQRYLSNADQNKTITYPETSKVQVDRTFGSYALFSTVTATSNVVNQLLVKYGYAEKKIVLKSNRVIDSIGALVLLMNGKCMPMYLYTLIHDVPVWFQSVVAATSVVPYVPPLSTI